MEPYFSIIVVAYNAEPYIAETINSILCQTFCDYEVIVKDAKSKDNTLKEIPKSDKIKIYSELDKGIYDGMNRGIEHATGKFLCFLNCGDSFYSNNVLKDIHDFAEKNHVDTNSVIYGDYFTKGMLAKLPKKLSKDFLIRRPLCHQTMFFGYRVFEKYGLYDCNYKILADYNLTLKSFCDGVKYYHSDIVVCFYLGGGYSTQSRKSYQIENQKIQKQFYTRFELTIYKIKRMVTLTDFRIYITSDKSPVWLRKAYRYVSNIINS